MNKAILLLLVAGILSSCLKDDPFKLDYRRFEPRVINDDWLISTAENENINTEILEQ